MALPKIISVDDHVVEPPDLWTSRLPKSLHDRVPHVRRELGGFAAGKYDPNKLDWAADPDGPHPGCYARTARLADMAANHTDVSLCFPTVPRFCGQIFMERQDKKVGLECVR